MFRVSSLSPQTKGLVFGFAAVALSLPVYAHLHSQHTPKKQPSAHSIAALLPYYGFQTPAQKQALVFLMQQASVLKPDQSLEDRFPSRENQDALLGDILSFVQATQEAFTIRQGKQERWEIEAPAWLKENPTALLSALRTLGMTDAIKPTLDHPDVLCILGSTLGSMTKRLHYAKGLLEDTSLTPKHLVLLAGERHVTLNVDGSPELLESIAKNHGIPLSALTETHLIQEAYNNVGMPKTLTMTVIDTPKGDLPRPTTETTVIELSKWLKQHPEYKTIGFVSNQPHVYYQAAVIKEILRRQGLEDTVKVEVIGPSITSATPTKDITGALGSRIWASTPHVIQVLGLETQNPDLLKQYQGLYKNQPLVYKNAPPKITGPR